MKKITLLFWFMGIILSNCVALNAGETSYLDHIVRNFRAIKSRDQFFKHMDSTAFEKLLADNPVHNGEDFNFYFGRMKESARCQLLVSAEVDREALTAFYKFYKDLVDINPRIKGESTDDWMNRIAKIHDPNFKVSDDEESQTILASNRKKYAITAGATIVTLALIGSIYQYFKKDTKKSDQN